MSNVSEYQLKRLIFELAMENMELLDKTLIHSVEWSNEISLCLLECVIEKFEASWEVNSPEQSHETLEGVERDKDTDLIRYLVKLFRNRLPFYSSSAVYPHTKDVTPDEYRMDRVYEPTAVNLRKEIAQVIASRYWQRERTSLSVFALKMLGQLYYQREQDDDPYSSPAFRRCHKSYNSLLETAIRERSKTIFDNTEDEVAANEIEAWLSHPDLQGLPDPFVEILGHAWIHIGGASVIRKDLQQSS